MPLLEGAFQMSEHEKCVCGNQSELTNEFDDQVSRRWSRRCTNAMCWNGPVCATTEEADAAWDRVMRAARERVTSTADDLWDRACQIQWEITLGEDYAESGRYQWPSRWGSLLSAIHKAMEARDA